MSILTTTFRAAQFPAGKTDSDCFGLDNRASVSRSSLSGGTICGGRRQADTIGAILGSFRRRCPDELHWGTLAGSHSIWLVGL